jgi:hypothetical protein
MAEPMVWAEYQAMAREEDGEGGRGRPVMTTFEEQVPLSVFMANNGPGQKYIGARDWVEKPNQGNFLMDGLSPLLTMAGIAGGANFLGPMIPNFGGGGTLSSLVSSGGVPVDVASETFVNGGSEAINAGQGLQMGAGGETGLTMGGTGSLPTMGGGQGLVAPGATSFGMGATPAAVGAAGATGSFLGGNGAGAVSSALPNLTGGLASGAGTAAGSALSRILSGSATTDDYLKTLGGVAGAGLGAYASNEQTNSLRELADKYFAVGAPSRGRFEASMTSGFDPLSIPGYSGALDTAADAVMRKLSAKDGNPYGNPGALMEANKYVVNSTALPAIQNYQGLNMQAGGFGNYNAAAPGASTAAIGSQGNTYNAIGAGVADLTNPKTSLADLWKQFQRSGGLT